MPSGKTHDRITWFAALPTVGVAWGVTHSGLDALLSALGLVFAGLMFGPDLDLKSRQYYRWGPFRWIWWPYQRCFKHRSAFTHGLILGLPVRLLYVTGLCVLAGGVMARVGHPLPWHRWAEALATSPPKTLGPAAGSCLAGLWLGGALHTFADRVVSGFKRFCGPRRPPR